MQEARAVAALRFFLAPGDLEQVLLGRDVDLVRAEARDGQGNAIAIFGNPFDVERRVIVALLQPRIVFDQVEQTVETHGRRSEEHTSELQSLMRISYAVFCLEKKK